MKRSTLIIILTLTLSSFVVKSQTTANFFTKSDAFFSSYVASGKVNYKAINTTPAGLDELLNIASAMDLSNQSADTKKAFWINAYNLAVIKGVIDNYPIKSPLDKKGFFDKITYNLAGKKITLNDLENKMIRAIYNDARIHFVLVCGAIGCPPLINEAYLPESLDTQLERQTKAALNSANFIQVKKSKVLISEIFKWYNEDFVNSDNDLIDFLNAYRNDPIPSDSKLGYYNYDWKLNTQ